MTIMKGIKQGERWKVCIMKPLLDWVCKSQNWVENADQTQLKPIIWYTSWYFSRGGKKNFAKLTIFPPPPYRILISAPA